MSAVFAALMALALVAGITPPASAAPADGHGGSAPVVPHDRSIPVSPVVGHYHAPKAMPVSRPPAVSWPSGKATVTVGSTPTQAGSLPVWLSPTGKPAAPTRATPAAKADTTIVPKATAAAAGVTGVVMAVQRADGATAPGTVHITLGYSRFAGAFGGDWVSRLHLVTLPVCALTTPANPACRTRTPIAFSRDATAGTLSANITLPGATSSSAAPLVVAADSSSGGGGGDYSATSLKPSGSWQAGGSADAFTWSYPISVPSVPGGLAPTVGLSYDSQAVDGLTSSTNNQASWIGDGWDYSPGFIERSYASCHDNPAGPTQTWDTCWSATNTLTLSLGGQNTVLVKDDATGTYHPQGDSNERVQYLTGAANGAQNGEYFVVTTTDGTQYYFGLNQLPGWASGNPVTNSVWTEPVYAPTAGQPCYNATFSASWCQQAYRWNLDYVVDTHSDAVSYFYNTETNVYAADLGTTATASYIRGGYLTKIQYGQRAGQVYTTTPAAQVLFTTTGRCDLSSCNTANIGSQTSDWPDVPYDLNCAQNAACAAQGPSFWSEYVLQSIQTQALVGSTLTTVDSWSLAHTFPATGDATTPSPWLSSITRTGQDTTAGGSSSPITVPAVSFTGMPLSNRVNLGEGYPPITRYRLTQVTTETGETINANYSAPGCASGTPSDPSQNTMLCFPDYWTPTGQTAPILDWFNKFIVTGVTEDDPTGGSANDTIATTYTPVGTPAWHYNDNPATPASQRTWDQWRGYPGMIVSVGTAPDPVTKTQYTYFRGMNGDTLPNNGTRNVSITDSRTDPAVPDNDQYAGMTYETITFNGSAVVTDTITDPWSSPATATHTMSGLPALQAFLTGTATQRVYTPLANGTTRETETDTTHDTQGRVIKVNDQGDVSTTADDLCTTTTYADNTTAWILDKPADTTTVSVNCATTPSFPTDAVSDTLTYYDNSTTPGAAPTAGDVTQTQKAVSYTGSTPNYVTTSDTVDQYGRVLSATDADTRTTHTAYTPATGAQPTTIKVTDPKTHITTTTLDPLRDLTLSTTDPAGFVTSQQYDALGRLTAVTKPGIADTALKYSYTLSNTGPSVVDTYTLNYDGSYRLSETLYDALLRARETQTQTPDNGRDITDTIYNTDGWVSETTDPYFNSTPVATTYVQAQAGQVPSATGNSYDNAGRKTAAIAYALGSETWRTTYTYGGNFTTTVPPAGGTATTTLTDARGRTTDLYQYHTGVPTDPITDPASDYADTRYTYTPAGKQATVTDPAGNTWTYGYDLLGNQTQAQDPDTGTTTNTYDNASQLITTTDARGKQTTTQYDTAGRKTGTFDTTGNVAPATSNQITGYTYDTAPIGTGTNPPKAIGYPASTTSHSGGDTVTQTILGYNFMAKPGVIRTNLTGESTTLFPSSGYVVGYGYSPTGYATDESPNPIDGLPSETISTGYDAFGEPTGLAGNGVGVNTTYVTAVGYSEYGQPLQYTMPATGGNVWLTNSYDDQTHALTDIQTTDSNSATVVDDTRYSYQGPGVSTGAGLVVSTTDKQNGGASIDTQCFGYDYAQRLTGAWTGTDGCATTPTPGNTGMIGGPNPYWQSWTYDPAGNRATQTDHDPSGTTTNDTTTTDTYPTAGSATDQPHTLTSTSATGPNAAANTASYTYDAAGNTTSITGGATGNQTLTWTDQNQLATDTTTAGTSSYVYDADGSLVVRRDPGQVTVFLGDQQLVLNTATNTVSATRYYSLGGVTLAERDTTGQVQYLVPDRQGTDQLTINSGSYAVTTRHYLPFGQPRGTTPTTWPGDKGYVGGTVDTTTQLDNLGAREYNPTTGRFLSPDPVFEATDPNQLGGYDYAGNNPVTDSDPTGLMLPGGAECGKYVPCYGSEEVQGWGAEYLNMAQAPVQHQEPGMMLPPVGTTVLPQYAHAINRYRQQVADENARDRAQAAVDNARMAAEAAHRHWYSPVTNFFHSANNFLQKHSTLLDWIEVGLGVVSVLNPLGDAVMLGAFIAGSALTAITTIDSCITKQIGDCIVGAASLGTAFGAFKFGQLADQFVKAAQRTVITGLFSRVRKGGLSLAGNIVRGAQHLYNGVSIGLSTLSAAAGDNLNHR